MREGTCPKCGEYLAYDRDSGFTDTGVEWDVRCPSCKWYGVEGCKLVFEYQTGPEEVKT